MAIAPATAGAAAFLDDRPLSGLQIRTLVLCALVAVLDGTDTHAMGIGAPSIAAAMQVAPSAMGWAISGSWLGAAFGAILFGGLADRFGRKPLLIGAILTFGLFTLLTPFAGTLPVLVAVRVLAGIGLGGATPCFIALASEYAPARMRGSIVSLVWAAFPLGILLGGMLNGLMLAWLPWQYVFYVGGALPVLVAILLLVLLPESIGFLLTRRADDPRAARIIAAIAPGMTVRDAAASGMIPARDNAPSLSDLFRGGRLRTTLCIWTLLFACFGTTASMAWVPTVLRQHGVSLAAAAVAASFLGFGALLGMAVAGRLVDRFGPVRALVGPVVLGAAATAALGVWPGSAQAASVFTTLVGALVGVGASGGIALIATVYPTAMRSTGAGWALGLGRFGQVVVPAGFALLLHQNWSAQSIFVMLGVMPLLAAGAALLLGSALRATQGSAEPTLPVMTPRVAP